MNTIVKLNTYIAALLLFSASLQAVSPKHLKSNLYHFSQGKKTYLAMEVQNEEHWHTYWKNPGDAGKKWQFTFKQGEENLNHLIKEQEWPTPKTFYSEGDVVSYGFDQTYYFFFEIKPEAISKLKNSKLDLSAKYLICKNICLPGEEKHTISFNGNSPTLPTQDLKKHLSMIPAEKKESPIKLEKFLNPEKEKFLFKFSQRNVTLEKLKALKQNGNLLYLFPNEKFIFLREEVKYNPKRKELVVFYEGEWNGKYLTPEVTLPKDGKFKQDEQLKIINNIESSFISSFKLNNFKIIKDGEMKKLKSKYQKLSKYKL